MSFTVSKSASRHTAAPRSASGARQMSAQAFDLGSKAQSAADTVQTSIKGTVNKVQSSASQEGGNLGTSITASEPLPSDLTSVRKDIDSKVQEATSKLGEALTSETPFAGSKVPKSVDAANAANGPSPGIKTI
ncbi:MAG: hypothetical protein WDW38_009343 [Sanguina aurantia]